MTKTQSAFGLQIDSLADVVSFGAAPALLIYSWTLSQLGTLGMFVGFVFVACGAIRLARFNVLSMDQTGAPAKPSKYIVGLPIPGAAGILVSLVVANAAVQGAMGGRQYVWVIVAVTLLLAGLMVSNVRFRSFKDLRLNARTVMVVAFAVGSSAIVATQLEAAFVLVWLLGFYVAMGIVEWLWQIPRRLRGEPRESTAPDAPDSAPSPKPTPLPGAPSSLRTPLPGAPSSLRTPLPGAPSSLRTPPKN
jgi:CDP-diacylglycerol--serine O-phosphatidyltransferase